MTPKMENKRRLAVVDNMTPDDCLQSADPAIRGRLSTRKPAKIAFIDNKVSSSLYCLINECSRTGQRY